ncbi:SDR family NAD(P)-dependent oxidoreductase [Actinopolymorpha alba]|uniref:SDR family NAD(P)-dependent oxidoreductase n=1 Tax=Actinopolymorpha alba TaxID=533267 RepID=UPI0003737DDF|nr:SDR family NAD(P)-dependent oxidoreductase [Actinopolymorpha alba]
MPVALVTGASRGLGLALAGGLADHGWSLVVDARSEEPLRDAAAEHGARVGSAGEVVALAGSVTDPDHRAALVRAARDLGGLDLLVNNAGTLGPSPLPAMEKLGLAAYREILEVGVVAPLALTQLALAEFRGRQGAIVNITSDAAVEAYAGWGGYGSAKAAFEQWSSVLAVELSEAREDVRVWWVDPGDLRTQMHQDAFPGEDISDRPLPHTVVPAFLRLIGERRPSGRYRAADLLSEVPA